MDEKIQDLSWACLPKEVRNNTRSDYEYHLKRYEAINSNVSKGAIDTLEDLFGHHNLISDTEPSECICINKEKFDNFYNLLEHCYNHDSTLYDDLYWKFVECLPDKEPSVQVEPKQSFNKGDKVKIILCTHPEYINRVGIITSIDSCGNPYVKVEGLGTLYHAPYALEPYTEPESRNLSQESANCDKTENKQLKDNMENKELKRPLPPPRPKTKRQDFVDRANVIHNNKYEYPDEYVGSNKKLRIICPIHGDFWQTPNSHLKGHGCWKCASEKNKHLIYGVGENDLIHTKEHRILGIWRNMLARCYDEHNRNKYPTYAECSVCDEWHIFSNFLNWYKENNPYGFELDKDILHKDNKVYSPDTCCFVPKAINVLVRPCEERNSVRTMISGKFQVVSKISKGHTYREAFETYEEALEMAKIIRLARIRELAVRYYSDGKIKNNVFKSLLYYDFN